MRTRQVSSDSARRWLVTGRVQGVGFRAFVQRRGTELQLVGWVRNLDDGRVEAYAAGSGEKLDLLAAALHVGPRFCEVRAVDEQPAVMQQLSSFEFRQL